MDSLSILMRKLFEPPPNITSLVIAAFWGRLDVVQYFEERQIDKQNVVYVSKQYNLPVGIQQLILSYM